MQPQMENIHCTMCAQPSITKYINKQRGPFALYRFGYKRQHWAHCYQYPSLTSMLSPPLSSAQQLQTPRYHASGLLAQKHQQHAPMQRCQRTGYYNRPFILAPC